MIYHVQKGDTLYSIAKEYGVSAAKIATDNALTYPDRLIPGQELLILKPSRTYTVRRGDTVKDIAERFGIPEKTLYRYNPSLSEDERLYPGRILTISYSAGTHGALTVNGYVYPGCDGAHFRNTLNRVQYYTFSCCHTDGHSLRFTDRFETYRKEAAAKNVLCLCRVCLSDDFDFSVFDNPKSANALAETVADAAQKENFDGVTAAFYGIGAHDGFSVLKALKDSLSRRKMLFFNETNGNENAPITEYADATVLMYEKANLKEPVSFEDGEIRLLKRYEKTGKAPAIMVDISPFAYLDGVPVTKQEALVRAIAEGGTIRYDEETKLSSFTTRSHNAVFESLENIKAKFALLDELGFMGIAIDVMRTDTPVLLLAATEFAPVNYVFYSVKET